MTYKNIFICYTGGTSGAFIAAIVNRLRSKEPHKAVINISDLGNCHATAVTENLNVKTNKAGYNVGVDNPHLVFPDYSEKEYVDAIKLDHSIILPLIVVCHVANYEYILSKFPDSKIIFISSSIHDSVKIAENRFFKIFMEYSEWAIPNWKRKIKILESHFPNQDIKPWQINRDQYETMINYLATKDIERDTRWFREVIESDQVLKIDFNAIINGDTNLLKQLASFLEMESDDYVDFILERYKHSQNTAEIIKRFKP